MMFDCKCSNCEKEISKFTEGKKASDDNIYCYECFSSLNLLEKKKKSKPISIVGVLLKVLSIVYLISSLSNSYSLNYNYNGEIFQSSITLTVLTISLFLWALGTIVQKVCEIANNTSK